MSRGRQFCTPPFHPSPGNENIKRHSSLAGLSFYTVGVGHNPGIYTQEHVARKQVEGFSNARWKKASTYAAAVDEWNRQCELYHDHSLADTSDLSALAESPPSSLLSMLSLSPAPSPTHASPSPQSPLSRRTDRHALDPSASLQMPSPPSAPSTPSRASRFVTTPSAPSATSRPSPVFTPSKRPRRISIQIMPSTRNPGQWREGDILWGAEGSWLLFEDRYDLIDHFYQERLSPARVMESSSREEMEAFVSQSVE